MQKKGVLRFLKWLAGILAGLFLLITVALFAFKDDICGLVIEEVNKHLKSKVTVSEVDLAFWGSFPNLSIDFNEVFIQDSYEQSTELDTLLYSKRIRLKFNPMDIWRENYTLKSIEISPGVLNMRVNSQGVNNYAIFRTREDSLETEKAVEINLKEVEFEGFRYVYNNEATNQHYSTFIHEMTVDGALNEEKFTAKAKGDVQVVTARSGSVNLVKNKPAVLEIGIDVDKTSGSVTIPVSTIFIAGLPFEFQGNVREKGFNFNLRGKNIRIQEAANNLALRETGEVKKFSGQGLLLFDLNINGTADPVQPVYVDCKFGVKGGLLRDPYSGISLSDIRVDGAYSNKGGEEKEFLTLENIRFQTKGGPFKGNLKLTHFSDPLFKGDADGTVNLGVLHSLFSIPQVERLEGAIDVHTEFTVQGIKNPSGQLDYHIDKLNGNIQMHAVHAQLKNDHRVFENMTGMLFLRDNEAGLQDVQLKIGQSDFKINGVFKEMVNYISGEGKLIANVEIESDQIHIEELDNDTKEEKILRERAFVLPNTISGTVFLDVNTMHYDNHVFESISGNMIISERTVHFPRIEVTNGGAEIHGSLTIFERTPEIFVVSTQLLSKDIQFHHLFKEWENFNQRVITSQNISGSVQANIQFEAPFDLRSGIISNAIEAKIGIQIDEGRLKNVDAFEEVIQSLRSSSAKLVLNKREIELLSQKLKDLRFDQLSNTFVIRDGVLTVPKMKIASSVLDIDLSGTHTFDNQIDYHFGFYLRDLKQEKESEFGVSEDDGLGISIFMRMHGSLDNPMIEWDKEARKEQTKAYNEAEKEQLKSMLKSEFGLFQKDSTVKTYKKESQVREEVIIQFDPVKDLDTLMEVKKPKRDTKVNRLLEKWKEESKKEEVEFEVEY